MSAWPTPITWTTGQTVTASQMNTNVRDTATWLKAFADLVTNSTAADTGTTTYLSVTRAATTDGAIRSMVTGDTVPRWLALAGGRFQWSTGAATADTFLERHSTLPGYVLVDGTPAEGGTLRVNTRDAQTHGALQVYVSDGASPGIRMSLGVRTTNSDPEMYWKRAGGNIVRLAQTDDGRMELYADSGYAKIAVVHGGTGDNNAFFAWRSGDTYPRVALGQDSNGYPKLAMGAGNAAADVVFQREAANVLTSTDTAIRLYRGAGTSGALAIRTTGDSSDRMILYAGGYADIIEISAPAVPAANACRLFVEDNGAGKTRLVAKFNTGSDVVLATQA